MRVLLFNSVPFSGQRSDATPLRLAEGLLALGHEVEAVIVDRETKGNELFPVRRVVARSQPAGGALAFDFPCFESNGDSHPTFDELTNAEFEKYRDVTRRALDASIEDFNPHIVHAQHIWLQGHLALEAGTPYVLTAHPIELNAAKANGRYLRIAQEAAENAGRVIASSDALRDQIEAMFGALDGRVVTLEPPTDHSREAFQRHAHKILEIYRAALRDRFGEKYSPE